MVDGSALERLFAGLAAVAAFAARVDRFAADPVKYDSGTFIRATRLRFSFEA